MSPGAPTLPAMPAWQMPQGGIDPGETPRQAALRELDEEIGTCNAEIVAESREWMTYDLPAEARRPHVERALSRPAAEMVRHALYRQRRGYRPRDSNIPNSTPWRWVAPEQLPELIVSFKRQLYIDILTEFREHCRCGGPRRLILA